jgi:RNA polymerase sigma-70 factor, ECF subfamily
MAQNRGNTDASPNLAGTDNPRLDLALAYDTWAGKLYRYALMILADPTGAEDVLQQVFAKLLNRDSAPGPVAAWEPYLRTAVRNECYRLLARRAGTPGDLAAVAPFLEAAGPGPVDPDERAALERALGRLPTDQREIVHLKIYEDLTLRQIADRLDISINTAASRYRYAMDKLRDMLDPNRTGQEGRYE